MYLHIGAHDTACDCKPGFRGQLCDRVAPLHECSDEVKCIRQCPYDGSRENACSCDKDGALAPQDMTHFECTLRVMNASSEHGRGLEMKLQKQMTKYLRSSNLSKLDEAKILNISSSGEVRFHFLGHRKDGNRVRELMLALVEKGRLADFAFQQTQFSFKQEPTLLILRVSTNKKERRVRVGEEFTLSCTAQGSSGLGFAWLKDGVPVNTSIAVRNMSIWEEAGEQRTSHLRVQAADALDEGDYTCQAHDWGVQQCVSLRLSVVQPLLVTVAPMTSTVQKGSNLTIRCFTANKPGGRKLGYNWTKNKALFPMVPGSEYWEDLYPDGSILKLQNIQKGGLLTCSAAAGSWSGSASSRLDVVDSPLAGSRCPGSGGWAPTAPGLQASAPCPPGYSGTALRLCLLLEPGHGRWQVPDYSDCRSLHTIAITNAVLSYLLLAQFVVPIYLAADQLAELEVCLRSLDLSSGRHLVRDIVGMKVKCFQVHEFSRQLNRAYSIPLLVLIEVSLLNLVGSSYYSFSIFFRLIDSDPLIEVQGMTFLIPVCYSMKAAVELHKLWCLGQATQHLISMVKKFNAELYTICQKDKSNVLANQEVINIMLKKNEDIRFTAGGFFVLDHTLMQSFLGLELGYDGTTVGRTVWEVARSVGGRGNAYPGEAEPLVALLAGVLGYLRARSDLEALLNTTDNFVTAVHGILARKSSIVNHQTLLSLTETVNQWALWWGRESGGTWGHVFQGGVLISTLRVNPLQRRVQVNIPRHGFRYPDWLTGSIQLDVENKGLENDSVLAVVIYKDLKNFFPKHFSQKIEDGRDVEFGVDGSVVVVSASPGLTVTTLLQTSALCGSTSSGQTWELSACNLTVRGCLCPGRGVFAALASTTQLLKKRSGGEEWRGSLRVKVGCSCSLVQALVTALLLAVRYYRRPSCLLFLKIQSSLSLAGAMVIFLFAASDRISQKSYTYVCLGLQLLLLVAVSSQLAKMVIVYSEVLKIPMVRYFKQTVVIILTGLCGVCCLCTSIVEGYARQEPWWWLRLGSPSFCVAAVYTGALVSMQLAVGVNLACKISARASTKAKTSLNTRAGLVKRSAILLLFITLMTSCSVLYANSPTSAAQNAFSLASAALGFALFTVYIVMGETKPKDVLFLKRIKDLVADEVYSSTSDNSFFTKQEAEAECEAAPPDLTAQEPRAQEELLLRPAKPATPRKCVSFHSDLVTGCKVIEDSGGEEGGSPEVKGSNLVRASYYQNPSTDPAQGHLQEILTTRVCLELGLLQESGQSPPTLMLCNVDIEPSSRLVTLPQDPPRQPEPARADQVLKGISHDLDYLLNEGANSEEETQTSL